MFLPMLCRWTAFGRAAQPLAACGPRSAELRSLMSSAKRCSPWRRSLGREREPWEESFGPPRFPQLFLVWPVGEKFGSGVQEHMAKCWEVREVPLNLFLNEDRVAPAFVGRVPLSEKGDAKFQDMK